MALATGKGKDDDQNEGNEEDREPRTIVSHLSARTRLLVLGICLWGLGFLVATGPAESRPLVNHGSGVLLALLLAAISAVASILLVPVLASSLHGEGVCKLHWREAVPLILVLCAVLLFFATTNRHERFVGRPEVFRPDRLKLAADWLLAGGALSGIFSIAAGLAIGDTRRWRWIAAGSFFVIGVGLSLNASLFRYLASFSLSHTDFWGRPYIRACEELGFALWIVVCLCIVLWSPVRITGKGIGRTDGRGRWARRILLGSAGAFAMLTLLALLLVLLGILKTSQPWNPTDEVIAPSYWSETLGRVVWYHLLLLLVLLAASGFRVVLRGLSAISAWFVSVFPLVPLLATMGLLAQVWVTAYGVWLSRPWWPIWIPCIASTPIILLWPRDRTFHDRKSRFAVLLAVSSVLIVAGAWLWFRGPSLLYGWSHGVAWRVIIRRIIPLTLMAVGMTTIPVLYGFITTRRPVIQSSGELSRGACSWAGWRSILLCPCLVCGALLLGIMLELMHRIWLRYGTILPYWSSFACTIFFTTCIALVGSIVAWRILPTIPGIADA